MKFTDTSSLGTFSSKYFCFCVEIVYWIASSWHPAGYQFTRSTNHPVIQIPYKVMYYLNMAGKLTGGSEPTRTACKRKLVKLLIIDDGHGALPKMFKIMLVLSPLFFSLKSAGSIGQLSRLIRFHSEHTHTTLWYEGSYNPCESITVHAGFFLCKHRLQDILHRYD